MAEYVIPARIENGVRILELRHGNDAIRWQDRINNDTLDMSRGDSCVLAQAEESWFLTVRESVVNYAEDHSDFTTADHITSHFGFMVWCGFDHDKDESYTTLQTIWEEYLEWAQTEYRVWDENGDLVDSFRGYGADVKAQNSLNLQIESHKANGCEGCGVLSPHGFSIQVCREGRDITGEML